MNRFSGVSSFCIACVFNHCHRNNQNRRSLFLLIAFFFFDLESDEDVFDDESGDDGYGSGFASCPCLSSFFNYPLIVLVDFHIMESLNLVVVSVEYFSFPLKNFSSFKFRILNMITV